MNYKTLLAVFIFTISMSGYAFVDAVVSGIITGWQHGENINNTAAKNSSNAPVIKTKRESSPTDRWSEAAKKYTKPVQSIRGMVPLTSNIMTSDSDTAATKVNNIDKFLNDFSSKESAISTTPIVHSYESPGQAILLDEFSDGLEDLHRQQKKELRRQSQEMKRMLERNNQELMRQKMNYDLIHNWKPLGTR